MLLKTITNATIIFFLLCLGGNKLCAQFNVYDTLLTSHLFAHLDQEKKADYTLDKKGLLKRTVSLKDGDVHYHKSHEDSLHNFLKKAFPEKFSGFVFVAGENVKWTQGKDSVFAWKKGKKIEADKLKKVFSSLTEMPAHPKRNTALGKEEEEAHFFFYHNYLLDSSARTIWCFSKLEERYKARIVFDASGNITGETGYYPEGKKLYEVKGQILNVYYKNGNRMFCNDGKFIAEFDDAGKEKWRYEIETRKMTSADPGITAAKIHEYYTRLYALWKKEMGE